MNIKLKIDSRENKCKELFETKNKDKLLYEQLTFADFQICNEDKILYLFERKTINDLLASIKDGRYKNQKANISSNFQPFQYFYIIEGNVKFNSNSSNINDKITMSAIINTLIRDKMGIFFTKNENETVELLYCILNRVNDKPEEYLLSTNLQKCDPVLVTNKKNKDYKTVWKNQLCQIPDISEKTADAIIEHHPTLKQFYNSFSNSTKNEIINSLSLIKTTDSKGKKRKLSEKQIQNLYSYLLQNEEDLNENKDNILKNDIKEEIEIENNEY
jgi:ERCC4-type nuclease